MNETSLSYIQELSAISLFNEEQVLFFSVLHFVILSCEYFFSQI